MNDLIHYVRYDIKIKYMKTGASSDLPVPVFSGFLYECLLYGRPLVSIYWMNEWQNLKYVSKDR